MLAKCLPWIGVHRLLDLSSDLNCFISLVAEYSFRGNRMRSSSAFSFDERHPRDDRGQMHRMASREEPVDPYRGRYEYQYAGEKPPPHPRGHGAFSPSSRYPHSLTPRSHLQSVVTTSFSIEDEREDRGARRFGSVERRSDVPEREDVGHSEREDHYYAQGEFEAEGPRASPSERASATAYLQRSFSAGSAKFKSEPMKRSYYHHSRPNEVQTGQLPADFMPPKRVKLEQSNSREMMVTPRSPPGGGSGEWYARAPTWESEEDPYARFPRAQSFPPTHQPWGKPVPSPMSYRGERQAGTPKDHTHVSPGSETESPRHWQGSDWGSPSSRPPTSGSTSFRFWDSSPTHRGSDDYESPRMGRPQMVFQRRPMPQGKMQLVVDAAAAAEPRMEERFAQHGSTESIMLLALPQDRVALSETLCVVREVRIVLLVSDDHWYLIPFVVTHRILKSSRQPKPTSTLQRLDESMPWSLDRSVCGASIAVTRSSAVIE